jgi:transcriptional regulator with XRE-family HTH domain
MGIGLQLIGLSNGFSMEFHDNLKRLREAKGLTQAQVAEAMGSAKNTYIGYEKGTREPRLSELKKLADVLGVDLGKLCLEGSEAGLTGVLKYTLARAEMLEAKERYCLYKVIDGYINSCEIQQIKSQAEYHEHMDHLWSEAAVREVEEAQVLEMVKEEEFAESAR